MGKIYLIRFHNGERYDSYDFRDWGYVNVNTEDEVKKIVDRLDSDFHNDEKHYVEIENKCSSIEKILKITQDVRELQKLIEVKTKYEDEMEELDEKYPSYWMGHYNDNAGFTYSELEKIELD